jgi:16S rRNA processing protein RimM
VSLVRVGRVTAAFGIRGAVKVEPLTDYLDRFDAGSELYLRGALHSVEWSRPHAPGLVVKLAGLDTRTLAELHRGQYLEIGEDAVRKLPAGAWYHHELIGLDVVAADGTELGRLTQVLRRPANDVWVAQRGGIEQMIPAVHDAIVDVDLEAGRVVVADWLLQVEEA